MIDYSVLKRYGLFATVRFSYFDRCWHGIVGTGEANDIASDYADQDPDVALAKSLDDYLARMRPKPIGSA